MAYTWFLTLYSCAQIISYICEQCYFELVVICFPSDFWLCLSHGSLLRHCIEPPATIRPKFHILWFDYTHLWKTSVITFSFYMGVYRNVDSASSGVISQVRLVLTFHHFCHSKIYSVTYLMYHNGSAQGGTCVHYTPGDMLTSHFARLLLSR
jgi:uncharacterized membrane protein